MQTWTSHFSIYMRNVLLLGQTAHNVATTLTISLVKNGGLLILTGLLWGVVIHRTPHPRIALSTHMTLLQHGLLNIAASVVLKEVTLNDWQLRVVGVPHFMLWGLHAIGMLNAWWGANRATKSVSLPFRT